MTFGAAPGGYNGRPVLPRRDLTTEAARPPMPGVPRAPRAKPKSHSRGTFAREVKANQPDKPDDRVPSLGSTRSSTPTRSSEARRPREESPFTYARSHSLSREQAKTENQEFSMGPVRNCEERTNFGRRGPEPDSQHRTSSNPPWCAAEQAQDGAGESNAPQERSHARQRVLQRERDCAQPGLEWGPQANAQRSEPASHARRRVLSSEHDVPDMKAQDRAPTFARVLQRQGDAGAGGNNHEADEHAGYGRRNMCQKQGVVGHDDSYSRVMGR